MRIQESLLTEHTRPNCTIEVYWKYLHPLESANDEKQLVFVRNYKGISFTVYESVYHFLQGIDNSNLKFNTEEALDAYLAGEVISHD